jgi:protein associated with RNAse G/E
MQKIWNSGDIVVMRGIFNGCICHAQSVIVVKDTSEETALALLPGAECVDLDGYLKGKQDSKRRWDFKDKAFDLEKYTWHTNRLLLLIQPQKYYSTIYFWQADLNTFLCYYINFQLPIQRSPSGFDTLDLELDIIIHPDYSWRIKDIDDYKKGIENGTISYKWTQEIEDAKEEVFDRLASKQYPLDNSWVNWRPDPNWTAPKLPANWDKV